MEKLATQVIKNLQVKISSIHLRYEDDVSAGPVPGFPMCFWVTVCAILTSFGVLNKIFFVFQLSEPERPLAMGVTLSELSLQVTQRHAHTFASILMSSVTPINTQSAVFCRQLTRTGSPAS